MLLYSSGSTGNIEDVFTSKRYDFEVLTTNANIWKGR